MRKLLMAICAMTSVGAFLGAYWYWDNVYTMEQVAMAPVPSPQVSWTTVPTSEPTDQPSTTPVKLPKNPRGEPKQLIIWRGDTVLISMYFDRAVYTARGWGSECGKVAYRNRDSRGWNWTRPGHLSESRALITGHVWCDRETYSMDNLRKVKADDRVEIHYTSGDVVVGFAEHDAENVVKAELNAETEGESNPNLYNASPMRTFRVSTCDTDSPLRSDEHLSKSTYVPYAVSEIRYALPLG